MCIRIYSVSLENPDFICEREIDCCITREMEIEKFTTHKVLEDVQAPHREAKAERVTQHLGTCLY